MATKTIKLKIVDPNKGKLENLHKTKAEIDNLLSFYIKLLFEYPNIVDSKSFIKETELLTNRTKNNPVPKIPIELEHTAPPSILKRSIVKCAVGKMKSFLSNYNNWQGNGKKQGEPKPPGSRMNPVFYYSDFKLEFNDIQNQFVSLRVFDGKGWSMTNYPVKFTKQFLDMHEDHLKHQAHEAKVKNLKSKLIRKGAKKKDAGRDARETIGQNPHYKMCSPTLRYKRGDWYLCFPFDKKISMKKLDNYIKEKQELTTLAVDLGITHTAVITIKRGDDLLKTEFISGKKVNDLRYKALQKITKKQRLSSKPVKGERSNKKLWAYVSNLNEDMAHKISRQIVDLAKNYNVDVIIFENLKGFRQKKGVSKTKKMNLKRNYWLHGKVIKYARYKAYHEKIYVVERSAFMTSQIHYKGDQAGERFSPLGTNRKNLIVFKDKSILNANFNASMNMHRKFDKTFPKINSKEAKLTKKDLLNYITQNLIVI